MPRTNSRAKKIARQRQQETGERYARARRLTPSEQEACGPPSPVDWRVSLDGRDLTEDFIITEDGTTYGPLDYGVVVGLEDPLAPAEAPIPWGVARLDLAAHLGKRLVSRSRFTEEVGVVDPPLTHAVRAADRALRSVNYGGYEPPLKDDGHILRRRNLARRVEHGIGLRQEVTLVARSPQGREVAYSVSAEGRLRKVEEPRSCVGVLDYFSDDINGARVAVEWGDFHRDPGAVQSRVLGTRPLVWAADRDRVDVGEVVGLSVGEGGAP